MLTCLDVLVECAVDVPLTWCPQNALSAQCRPCCTRKGFCIHLSPKLFLISQGKLYFLVRQAQRLDVVLGQYSADSVEYKLNRGQEVEWAWFIIRFTDIWIMIGCNHSVWKRTSGTPTSHAGCLHCKEHVGTFHGNICNWTRWSLMLWRHTLLSWMASSFSPGLSKSTSNIYKLYSTGFKDTGY
jgi:hypothetical protein